MSNPTPQQAMDEIHEIQKILRVERIRYQRKTNRLVRRLDAIGHEMDKLPRKETQTREWNDVNHELWATMSFHLLTTE